MAARKKTSKEVNVRRDHSAWRHQQDGAGKHESAKGIGQWDGGGEWEGERMTTAHTTTAEAKACEY